MSAILAKVRQFDEHYFHNQFMIYFLQVPVITIFTKFDSLDAQAFHFLRNTGMSRKEAKAKAQDYATQDFNKVHLPRILEKKFPPADTLCLRGDVFLGHDFKILS